MSESKGPGREPRNPVDVLRTKIWMAAVFAASGLTPGQIEALLEPERVRREGGRTIRPRLWDRYASGDHVPNDNQDRKPVSLAEARWPGTAVWFRSPMWRALRPEPVTAALAEQLLGQIEPLRDVLFVPSRWNPSVLRQAAVDPTLLATIIGVGRIDALAAAMVFARQAEAIHSPPLRDTALRLYRHLQPQLEQLPALKTHASELFWLIDTSIKEWVYPDPGSQVSVTIFSEEVRRAQGDS